MHLEYFIGSTTVQDADGEVIASGFASESAAADFAIRLAQDAGATTYSMHYGQVA